MEKGGLRRPKNRCYLIYAIAPSDSNVRNANHLFNDYIADRTRGLCVFHDHFIARPGGIAIFDVRTDQEVDMLDSPGSLEHWEIHVHTLAESLTAVGFVAQMDYTLEQYGDTSVDKLRAQEEPKKRHWWNQPKPRDDASG